MSPGTYIMGALVHGVSAHVLDRILASSNVVRAMSAYPEWMQLELEATRRAIRRAAREYEALPIAEDGSAATALAEVAPLSPDEITTNEAGALLGLGERRVRQLAAEGMGRQVGGRWLLDRTAVLAYAGRRRPGRGGL